MKSSLPATPAQRVEYKLVKGAFSHGDCVRRSLFQSFKVDNVHGWLTKSGFLTTYYVPSISVTYPDIVSAERCEQCSCCTPCSERCNCDQVPGESEVQQVLRILGIDAEDPRIQQAEEFRHKFVQEELLKIEGEEEGDFSEDGGEEDELEEDDEED